MVTQSVRIPGQLASRLSDLARATRRTKSSFIIEALERFLDEREDLEVAQLNKRERQRVFDAVGRLLDHPLKGEALSGKWKGLRRLRVGVYGIVYAFDGTRLLISVARLGHRREVYR